MEEKIRLALVDDHEIARLGIRRILEGEKGICLVGEAACGEEAFTLARRERPHVMLVDIKLPDISGIDVVRRLKEDPETSQIQLVILTVYDDLEIAAEAIRAGAIGYILKDSGREQLLGAINSAVKGIPHVASSITHKLVSTLFHEELARSEEQESKKTRAPLTDREEEVLRMVAKGYSNKSIARELGISLSTVKTHLRNIFRKMEVEDRAQVIVKAIKEGII